MKQIPIVLLSIPILTAVAWGQGTKAATPIPTIASAVDGEIGSVEKQVLEAAEAMPEDKLGVRTFALQVKHIAASNYAIWSPLTGEKIPEDFKGGDGPENLQTKPAILEFLKDPFALGS